MTVTHLAPSIDGDRLLIEGDAHRHLFRSRRLAVGDALRVVDGRGRARRATIVAVDRRRAEAQLGELLDAREPALRVHLVVGAPRPERAGWLVEKATELGVDRISFIASQRTPRDYGAARLERFARMAAAAVEQSGRSWCPPVQGVTPWDDAINRLTGGPGVVLVPGASALADRDVPATSIGVWIGPEGGFTDDEVEQLAARRIEAVGIGIGIARVETAAIAAAAVLLCR